MTYFGVVDRTRTCMGLSHLHLKKACIPFQHNHRYIKNIFHLILNVIQTFKLINRQFGAPGRTRTSRTSGPKPDDFANLPTGAGRLYNQ